MLCNLLFFFLGFLGIGLFIVVVWNVVFKLVMLEKGEKYVWKEVKGCF